MSNFPRSSQLYSLRLNAMTYFRCTPVDRRDRDRLLVSPVRTVSPLIGSDSMHPASITIYRYHKRMPGARNTDSAIWTLVVDYFSPNSIFIDQMFGRRFVITKSLLHRLANDLRNSFTDLWRTLKNASGLTGIERDFKLMAFLRMLTTDEWCDIVDDGARTGAETLRQ